MNTKLLVLTACGVALLAPARAQIDVGISAAIRLGHRPPPPPPEVVIVEDSGPPGPPPWAPAHGFRRNRDYYYYPAADVYYRPADRMWFYLDGGGWQVGLNLPTRVQVDFDHCVRLTMETDRPYQYHERVRVYYPHDYFVTKARVKENHGKRERGRGDDDHGPGKGKGRHKDQ